MSVRSRQIAARTVWTPAPEKTAEEYEDAFYPEQTAAGDGIRGATRFCLADGASEGGHSRQWARLLVSEWGKDPNRLSFKRSLSLAGATWAQWCHERDSRHTQRGLGTHDWYQAPFPEDQFGYATLLVVQIYPGLYPRWLAAAVGDTFVFHVRADKLVKSLPARTWQRSTPRLISTHDSVFDDSVAEVAVTSETLAAGDELFLSTDALAHWIFDEMDGGRTPWPVLRTRLEQPAFRDWVDELRAREELKRDDCTLMRIMVGQ